MTLRAITGMLLIMVILLCITAEGYWFSGLWLVFMAVAFYESYSFQGDRALRWPCILASLVWLLGCLSYLFFSNLWYLNFTSVAAIALYFTLGCFFLSEDGIQAKFRDFSTSMTLFIYVGVFYTPILVLAGSLSEPKSVLLFLFALFWLQDSFSYLGGRFFGKHPLAPVLSPKKTWEGAVIGLVLALVTLYFLAPLFPSRIGNWILVYGFLVGVSGQVGDLIESGIKRSFQIKDSGAFFPGHGGVLDRFDSVTAGSIVLMGLFLPDLVSTGLLTKS
jgi:phosphatidate cytidylyltransferase